MQRIRMRRSDLTGRFRQTRFSAFQAWRIRLWLTLIGRGLFRFRIDVEGSEHIPAGEPLIVAVAPHRNWIDPFLMLQVLPALPRLYFVAASDTAGVRWWKSLAIAIAGGMAPFPSRGKNNRAGLETSLAILGNGNRLGIFPEGWGNDEASLAVLPLKRGVAYLSARSGCRVLPVGIAGTTDLWRGATLRVRIAPPLSALPDDADKAAEQAFADRLRAVLQAAVPSAPPEPPTGKKPWRWLTRML